MTLFSAVLNLFLVPAVSLYIQLYHMDGVTSGPSSIRKFLQYCIFAVLNIPLTKILLKVFELLCHRSLSSASIGGYTMFALVVAVALPYLLRFSRKQFQKYVEIEVSAPAQPPAYSASDLAE